MPFKIISFGEILFDVFKDKEVLGGAPFNCGYHLHHFGQQVDFLTKIGVDTYGSRIKDFFLTQKLSQKLLQIDPIHRTGWVEVTLDKQGKPKYIIHLDVAWDFIDYNENVKSVVNDNVDLIYFGSLAQRNEHSRKTLQKILNLKSKQTKTFCDINLRQNFYSKEIIIDAFKNSNIVKVNDEEFEEFKKFFDLNNTEEESAKRFMAEYNIDYLCITKGERGSSIYTQNQSSHWENPLAKIDIIDTVGAGDAFSSILIYGILSNWPLDRILEKASQFAIKICTIPGAITEDNLFYQTFKQTL